MEKKFTSDEVPLAQLLEQARTGELQLPDFQRGWVWDDNHITSLLASISVSYPIGSVMILQTGNLDVRFKPRPLEGVVLAKGEKVPKFVVQMNNETVEIAGEEAHKYQKKRWPE